MNRISVVIASLLKPVDDTRMFEKLGFSLAQTNKYEINIIGFSIKKNIFHSNVRTFPVFRFNRTGFSRLLQPLKYLGLLFKVKPKVIIVNSIDLLLVTLFYSSITRTIFIYDVQENYYRNIMHNSLLPFPVKNKIAWLVRLNEYICHPFIHHYLVAEKGYLDEMPFIRKKGILLRNLYVDHFKSSAKKTKSNNKIRILYSGTIADVYGIFQTIHFIDQFHRQYPEIEMTIIGYCAHQTTLKKIRVLLADLPFIRLTGGDQLIPHEQIIEAIRNSDFGIINYELNPATINCFPTRIYEYMGNRLPVLIQPYPPWSDFCLQHDAGIEVDFDSPDYDALILEMKNKKFYSHGIPDEIFWKEDEPRLLDLFDKIYQNHLFKKTSN